MRIRHLAGLAALVAFGAAAAADASPRDAVVRWYWERAGEVPIGVVRSTEMTSDGAITTESAADFKWWQSGAWQQSSWSRKVIENADGRMTKFFSEAISGSTIVTGEGRVEGNVLKLTVTERGKEPKTHDVAWDNPVLGPAGLAKLRQSKGFKAGTRYAYWTWDWSRWIPAHWEATVEAESDTLQGPCGEQTAARLLVMAIPPNTPAKALLEWWKDGACVRAWTESAGTASRLLVDRDLTDSGGSGMKAQYSVDRGLVLSAGSPVVPRPSALSRATYRMGLKDGELGDIDLNGPGQKAGRAKDGSYLIAVEPGKFPKSGHTLPLAAPKDWEASLAESYWLGIETEEIKAAAARAVGGEKSGAKAVLNIVAAVAAHLEPVVLNSGIATAAEAWRQRQGDCLEQALAVIALCRASGIPARLAGGLRYAQTQMVYHAWPEVYLGKWYGVDALTATGLADAARIRFGVTQLADQNPEEALINIGTCVDRIDVKLLEAMQGPINLAANQPSIAGDTFHDKAWGVQFSAPPKWNLSGPAPGVLSAIARISGGRGRAMNVRAGSVAPHDTAWTQLRASLLGGFFTSSVEERDVDGRTAVIAKMEAAGGQGYSPLTAYLLDGETLFVLEYAGRAEDGKAAFDQILRGWKFLAKKR